MHKYYFTELDERIPFTRLYDEALKIPPGLTFNMVKDTDDRIRSVLNRKGKLFDNVIDVLDNMPTKEQDGRRLYMLIPVNMLLWLYELGNKAGESEKLFETISKRTRRLCKSKCKRYEKQRITLKDLPVTRRFKEKLALPGTFINASSRKFLPLQALISVMCCAVRGQVDDPFDLAHEIISEAAPGTVSTINAPIIDGAPRNTYSAIYSTKSPFWNIALIRTGDAAEMIHLLRALVWRANARMERVDSKRTTTISRLDFFVKLISYMELSANSDPIMCMDRENMAGSRKLW